MQIRRRVAEAAAVTSRVPPGEAEGDNMSDETVEGVLMVVGPEVFIIPRDDLRAFRVPDDVAAQARAKLADESPEVAPFGAGFEPGHQTGVGDRPLVAGVKFDLGGPLKFSSLMEHALTNSRLH